LLTSLSSEVFSLASTARHGVRLDETRIQVTGDEDETARQPSSKIIRLDDSAPSRPDQVGQDIVIDLYLALVDFGRDFIIIDEPVEGGSKVSGNIASALARFASRFLILAFSPKGRWLA
jgi:hypothetical protein